MGTVAGQTARLNGLKFFEGTDGYPGGNIGQIQYFFLIPRATPGISASI